MHAQVRAALAAAPAGLTLLTPPALFVEHLRHMFEDEFPECAQRASFELVDRA